MKDYRDSSLASKQMRREEALEGLSRTIPLRQKIMQDSLQSGHGKLAMSYRTSRSIYRYLYDREYQGI